VSLAGWETRSIVCMEQTVFRTWRPLCQRPAPKARVSISYAHGHDRGNGSDFISGGGTSLRLSLGSGPRQTPYLKIFGTASLVALAVPRLLRDDSTFAMARAWVTLPRPRVHVVRRRGTFALAYGMGRTGPF